MNDERPSQLRGACLAAIALTLAPGCLDAQTQSAAPEPGPAPEAELSPEAKRAPGSSLAPNPGLALAAATDPRPECFFSSPPAPDIFECPIHSCGNAATINNSIVEALDTRGQEMQALEKPLRLVPGTLTGASGGCAGVAGLSLGVRDGGFVGRAGLIERCAGASLVGARFQVEQGLPPLRTTAIIKIAARGTVATSDGSETLPTYDLVVEPAPAPPGVPGFSKHLCTAAPWGGTAAFPGSTPTYHALLIQGEVYYRDATVSRRGAHWFNIGCAGSGIAKMRLHGLDPMRHQDAGAPGDPAPGYTTIDQRQATLKMLTAKYCSATSWTKQGTPILFHGPGPAPIRGSGLPVAATAGPIESRWGPGGALCISHLRLWSAGGACATAPEHEWVQRIQQLCNIPACDETVPCSADDGNPSTVWKTCTVDHVPHAFP